MKELFSVYSSSLLFKPYISEEDAWKKLQKFLFSINESVKLLKIIFISFSTLWLFKDS